MLKQAFPVQEHYSFPSIVQMYTFNEGWGQYDTQKVVQFAHALNPSILWGPASGWVDPQDETFGYGSLYEHYTGYVSLLLLHPFCCLLNPGYSRACHACLLLSRNTLHII